MWMWKLWPFKRRVRVPTVSDDTLHIANRLRAQRKLPRLDRFTAQNAVASNYESPGFDMLGFLVAYETGIPVNLNTESFVGAALHSSTPSEPVEPMVPRYSIEERRREDESHHYLYTPSSTPVPSTTFEHTPERESYHSPSYSSPSYSSSDDNRSSYSSSDYGSSSSYDSSSSSSDSSSSSSSSSE